MTGSVPITKMSGAGNDFVVIAAADAAALGASLRSWVRRICRRGLSVGADGVLVLESAGNDRVSVTFYNPDGSEAFCGNGSRCAARYATLRGWARERLSLLTSIGQVPAEVRGGEVSLVLPGPEVGESVTFERGGSPLTGLRVDAGCPHVVVWIPNVDGAPIAEIAPPIRHAPAFAPAGANVDLVMWREDGSLAVRTWERGVEGETLSCGTGAIASACAARLAGGGDIVRVLPRSGVPLTVRFEGPKDAPSRVVLEGDARVVFEGEVSAEATTGFEDA